MKSHPNNPQRYVVTLEDNADGETCVKFPYELISDLGWEIGDEIEWEETEICEDCCEHSGLTLSNKSKLFRDADEAIKKAVSIDME